MKRVDYPVTTGVRFLQNKKIPFDPCIYVYTDQGGTSHAAACLRVPEHAVIKTLVMDSEQHQPFLVLMHGDREVSTKQLARQLGLKQVEPCEVALAERRTGYLVGGISPFGTRMPLRVCVQSSILELPEIYINGGKRGFLVRIVPGELCKAFPCIPVNVAIES